MTNNTYSPIQKIFAWSVHIFTASGLIAGFMAILAINDQDWRSAMLWLILCLFIDGIDGTFARLAKVKEVLPYMDGKTIDYVVDFVTYAVIPAYFFYMAGLVDESWRLPCTAVILLVSAIYYGKEGMVSDDMYFVGFPVMWNMVIFFMVFVYSFSPVANAIIILLLGILHFVPIKFVYPSQAKKARWFTIGVTVLLAVLIVAITWLYPKEYFWLDGLATLTLVYYGGMAVYDTFING